MNGAIQSGCPVELLDDLHSQGRRESHQSFPNVETWEFR